MWFRYGRASFKRSKILLYFKVSDGIIAPSYNEDALELLKKKKNGSYHIFQIDPNYLPNENGYFDERELFGIKLSQFIHPNTDYSTWLNDIVTNNKQVLYLWLYFSW